MSGITAGPLTTSPAGIVEATPRTPLLSGELEALNARFERAGPGEILRWAADALPGGKLVLSTSFGVGGIVLIHHLAETGLRLPVYFVDTLHHFPETLELAERVRKRYDVDLRILRPAPDLESFEAAHGPRLWEGNVNRFHRITKVEPMARALAGVEGWITGRRRDQSATRAGIPVLEETEHRLKINPLAHWTLEEVWAFVRVHELPYNPLHDQGYPSVGDAPLTTPIAPGEDERAGRWRGSGRLECGLHSL